MPLNYRALPNPGTKILPNEHMNLPKMDGNSSDSPYNGNSSQNQSAAYMFAPRTVKREWLEFQTGGERAGQREGVKRRYDVENVAWAKDVYPYSVRGKIVMHGTKVFIRPAKCVSYTIWCVTCLWLIEYWQTAERFCWPCTNSTARDYSLKRHKTKKK
jgi:hypothetical protein